ncbi:MAG TPA: NAD(P)/FAD-dependent oxidoreductase [Aggregatilineales bacterium]|nr:NAD(P)-binding domain-containing protein [Anaerolineales bacterium]HRE46779.1 NAD(P)/FAD-dependent oxidoreductase [Aggregatilineales bacterium]
MSEQIDTVIIGAGQFGLAVSYCLTQHKHPHVILEKDRIGEAWRSGKWDSFTLVSPNWTLQLPGFPYQGDEPDGYLTREGVLHYLEEYASLFNPPVRTGITVTSIHDDAGEFIIEADAATYRAANVVVATGAFPKPRIPAYASQIASHIHQIHTSQYRNPTSLPDGAILVVGSGQSGCQIAEELYKSGRTVYLCTSKVGRIPRRYRGKDAFWWVNALGMFDQTVNTLTSPSKRFDPNPQLTGKDGGRSLNLHRFASDGVTLLGHLQGADGTTLAIAGDLMENLAVSDKAEAQFKKAVDTYIDQNNLQAVQDQFTPDLLTRYDSEVITELDLDKVGIRTILWAGGYRCDFSWIKYPIFDAFGYPIHQRGITEHPGLYFIGLMWLHKSKSNLFWGVAEDAEYIAEHLVKRTS